MLARRGEMTCGREGWRPHHLSRPRTAWRRASHLPVVGARDRHPCVAGRSARLLATVAWNCRTSQGQAETE